MARQYKFSKVNVKGRQYYRVRKTYPELKRQNKKGDYVPTVKNFYGETKAEVMRKIDKFERDHFQELQTINDDTALGAAVDFYIREVFLPDDSLKESTKGRYLQAWNANIKKENPKGAALQSLAGQPLNRINGSTLQKCYNALECAPSTVRTLHKLLSRFYSYVEHEGITRDITRTCSLPKVEQKNKTGSVEVWEPEELAAILEKSEGHRLHFLFVLAANTGLRASELLALSYEDIDIEKGLLHVRRQVYRDPVFDENGKILSTAPQVRELKTKSSIRSVPLNSNVLSELAIHKKWQTEEMLKKGYRTNYVFTTSTGTIYDHSSLDKAYRRFCKRIGITPRGFHVFRHTFASSLANKHVPIETVADLLGHDSITTTAKYYVHVSSKEKQDAVELLTTKNAPDNPMG